MKIGERLRKLIGTVAPVLGGALGGPLGGVAGNLIQKALGVDSEDAALKMLESDPDALLKLKTAEMDFDKRMAELGIDEERLHQADRASAREMAAKTGDTTPRNLAYVYTLGFFSLLGAQFYIVVAGVPIDPNALRILDTATGVLFAMVYASKDYYFGSSSGSKAKTDLLARP